MNFLLVLGKNSAKSSGGYNVFPVGIAYVSAYLKSKGISTYTANLEFSPLDTEPALRRLIEQHSIDVVCTGGLSRDYSKVLEIIECVQRIDSRLITVVGGGIISGDALPAMKALNADFGVIGQGELTLYELACALNQGAPFNKIPGLVYRSDNGLMTTSVRTDIEDLDSLPYPDYDGFSFREYLAQINHEVAYVTASRSCPFKCTFCFHPSGSRYYKRSLDSVFDEIDLLLKHYGAKSIGITDELFSPKRDRVLDFCARIKPYNITWGVQLRVRDVDAELLAIMRDSGCTSISYGIESADDTVLKSMQKKITLQEIETALRLTHEANIDIQGGLIFGDPAETLETAENSLTWHARHPQYGLELNMINIFPGTPLYNRAVIDGVIKDRIDYLKQGCPLINVSTLSDETYRELASRVYEKNMRPKLEPVNYSLQPSNDSMAFLLSIECLKCKTHFEAPSDALHIERVPCPKCQQRHYVDPWKKLDIDDLIKIEASFSRSKIALWGAGELSIKFLDAWQENREWLCLVDAGPSRQGLSLCGMEISPPSIIDDMNVSAVLITVPRRQSEIEAQLAHLQHRPLVLVPRVEVLGDACGQRMFLRLLSQ